MHQIPRPKLQPGIKMDENVYVTMRDGIKIAVDIYRPAAEGRYPGLFSMSPYFKELQLYPPEISHAVEVGATQYFVSKGYVHVIASARGSGLSQGRYNWYDDAEAQDGYELVEWLARQPWCNGNVGMFGDSYFGRIEYLIASKQPPSLKCIAPFDAGMDDYRDSRNQGGLIKSGWVCMWGFNTMRQCLWPGPVEGKLPPADLFMDRVAHPDDGPYYWERGGWTKINEIKVPMLALALQNSATHSRGQLWGYPRVKSPKKLVVLPPSRHSNVFFMRSKPLNELILKFLDYWLKGVKNGVMEGPPVAICDNATKEWRYESEYPLARTQWTKLHLRANPAGKTNEPPYGLITREPPGSEEPDKYVFPDFLKQLQAGKPVLGYSTAPLDQDLRVWGPLSINLFASTTGMNTAWFVKLGDVAPDGKTTLLTSGLLKASYRELDKANSAPGQPFITFQNPELPEPGKVYEYPIELIPIFHTFKKGHKIWVQIASDDFEYHMQSHPVYISEMLPVPAVHSIYHDAQRPSHLTLPVIPDAPVIKPVEPPVSRITWPVTQEDFLQ